MPNLKLSDAEIDEVIAFLAWVGKIDTQGWPPRPILVSGAAIPGAATSARRRPRPHRMIRSALGAGALQPVATRVFRLSLHRGRREPGGPVTGRHRRDGRGAHRGQRTTTARPRTRPATSASRSSNPNAHVRHRADLLGGGQSIMPADYGADPQAGEQIDQLVAYLLTLK